jgi:ATP-dependent Clp protease ATP-binding subunit ClpA
VRCRDAEIARVVDILLRHGKNNPALVGRAGVGKTAIVEGLAQRIAAGDVPPALKDARLLQLDHVAMLAGTAFRGQYEERLRQLVAALAADHDLILFVDELHNLIGQGTALGVAMDAANMLKPALVRGDIRVIGATTGAEYDRWIRSDPALERRFQPVAIEELDAVQTWDVLVARRPRLERHHAVAVADDALRAAIVLTDQFVTERARPDKAIDVLDEACAHAQATAQVSPELDHLIRERRKVDARIRRSGAGSDDTAGAPDEREDLASEFGPVLERLGAELERIFGGGRVPAATAAPAAPAAEAPPAPTTPVPAPRRPATLGEQRAELDRRLREALERQGIVVAGVDVARVVSAAVGKDIQWAG